MTMAIPHTAHQGRNAHGAARIGAVAGLDIPAGGDAANDGSERLDFATLMREIPKSAQSVAAKTAKPSDNVAEAAAGEGAAAVSLEKAVATPETDPADTDKPKVREKPVRKARAEDMPVDGNAAALAAAIPTVAPVKPEQPVANAGESDRRAKAAGDGGVIAKRVRVAVETKSSVDPNPVDAATSPPVPDTSKESGSDSAASGRSARTERPVTAPAVERVTDIGVATTAEGAKPDEIKPAKPGEATALLNLVKSRDGIAQSRPPAPGKTAVDSARDVVASKRLSVATGEARGPVEGEAAVFPANRGESISGVARTAAAIARQGTDAPEGEATLPKAASADGAEPSDASKGNGPVIQPGALLRAAIRTVVGKPSEAPAATDAPAAPRPNVVAQEGNTIPPERASAEGNLPPETPKARDRMVETNAPLRSASDAAARAQADIPSAPRAVTRADRPRQEAARVVRPDATDLASVQPTQGTASVAPPVPPVVATAVTTTGVDLAGALGQRVVDLGVSGRWIDDIARQIATVAINPGHGSFRVASETLGAVRVDITPGSGGANILMTVDNAAAQTALLADHKRLIEDAQASSVRIGEVRVDRVAAPAQSQGSGTDNSGQQGGGNGSMGAQASLAQGNGQGNQPGRQDASALGQQANGNSPKTPFTRTVLNDAAPAGTQVSDRGRPRDNARYA